MSVAPAGGGGGGNMDQVISRFKALNEEQMELQLKKAEEVMPAATAKQAAASPSS